MHIKRIIRTHLWLIGCVLLSAVCLPKVFAEPLSSIIEDCAGKTEEDVRGIAAQKIKDNQLNAPSSPPQVPEHKVFEGYFKPNAGARLAVLSDDGCNVIIDGQSALSLLDKGQHLPDLSQSFRVVNYNFTEGKLYHVRVEYSNISYNPPTSMASRCSLLLVEEQQEPLLL